MWYIGYNPTRKCTTPFGEHDTVKGFQSHGIWKPGHSWIKWKESLVLG